MQILTIVTGINRWSLHFTLPGTPLVMKRVAGTVDCVEVICMHDDTSPSLGTYSFVNEHQTLPNPYKVQWTGVYCEMPGEEVVLLFKDSE